MSIERSAVPVAADICRYNLRPRGALAGSPLLRGLLTVLPREVFEKEVLGLLSETDLAMFSRCGRECREAVVASGLPRAGARETGGQPLHLKHFVSSVNMLSWAKASGSPWSAEVCFGITVVCPPPLCIQMLTFARSNNCPWGSECTLMAARQQSVELMAYLRNNGCPYHPNTFVEAVASKHDSPRDDDDMTFLQFLLQDGCPRSTNHNECCAAAASGDLTTLKWLRQRGFLWDDTTPTFAASHGHLNVIDYCYEYDCPWSERVFVSAVVGSRNDLQDEDDVESLPRRERCMNIVNWLIERGCPLPAAPFVVVTGHNINADIAISMVNPDGSIFDLDPSDLDFSSSDISSDSST